jgi:NTP pyrophosphatase (non-canonical NTP hydrolase)
MSNNTLTIQEYQQLAKRTCVSLGSLEKDLLHMKLGVLTEIGEILDIFKKELAYKKSIDIVNLGEELADVAWYACNEATFLNLEVTLEKYIANYKIEDFDEILRHLLYFDIQRNNHNDIIFTMKCIAEYYNLNFEKCLYNNIEKLKVRYPEKFTEEAALNRNLDEERKTLEIVTTNTFLK